MKTLDDVVIQLEKLSNRIDLQNAAHEKHSELLGDLLKVTEQIQVSQSSMANALTLLVAQLSDQKSTQARLDRIEEEVRQLKQTH